MHSVGWDGVRFLSERERERGTESYVHLIYCFSFSVGVINVRSSLPVKPVQYVRVGTWPGDGETSPCPGEREREGVDGTLP